MLSIVFVFELNKFLLLLLYLSFCPSYRSSSYLEGKKKRKRKIVVNVSQSRSRWLSIFNSENQRSDLGLGVHNAHL